MYIVCETKREMRSFDFTLSRFLCIVIFSGSRQAVHFFSLDATHAPTAAAVRSLEKLANPQRWVFCKLLFRWMKLRTSKCANIKDMHNLYSNLFLPFFILQHHFFSPFVLPFFCFIPTVLLHSFLQQLVLLRSVIFFLTRAFPIICHCLKGKNERFLLAPLARAPSLWWLSSWSWEPKTRSRHVCLVVADCNKKVEAPIVQYKLFLAPSSTTPLVHLYTPLPSSRKDCVCVLLNIGSFLNAKHFCAKRNNSLLFFFLSADTHAGWLKEPCLLKRNT